jgi:hypothetical protein
MAYLRYNIFPLLVLMCFFISTVNLIIFLWVRHLVFVILVDVMFFCLFFELFQMHRLPLRLAEDLYQHISYYENFTMIFQNYDHHSLLRQFQSLINYQILTIFVFCFLRHHELNYFGFKLLSYLISISLNLCLFKHLQSVSLVCSLPEHGYEVSYF